MNITPFYYARQVWICTIIMFDNYMKPCDTPGKCYECEEAKAEKQREAEDEAKLENLMKKQREAEG